jgi:hypothetical protein
MEKLTTIFFFSYKDNSRPAAKDSAEVHLPVETITDSTKIVNDSAIMPNHQEDSVEK